MLGDGGGGGGDEEGGGDWERNGDKCGGIRDMRREETRRDRDGRYEESYVKRSDRNEQNPKRLSKQLGTQNGSANNSDVKQTSSDSLEV